MESVTGPPLGDDSLTRPSPWVVAIRTAGPFVTSTVTRSGLGILWPAEQPRAKHRHMQREALPRFIYRVPRELLNPL